MTVSSSSAPAAGDDDTRPDAGEIGNQLAALVENLRSDGQVQLDRLAVGTVLVASHPRPTAPGLELVPRAKLGEIAQLRIGDQHDIAAVAAVAAVRSTLGDVLLATKGKAAVPAPPRQNVNASLVVERRLARCVLALVTAWTHV